MISVTKSLGMCFNSSSAASVTSGTRMWANAQRDGRPSEYRRCPLFNAAKFGWHPLLECRAVTLPKRKNPLKFSGVPQTRQQISAASRPKFTILWVHVEEILLLNTFFPIVDTCLNCEDIARQSCAMVRRWRFFASFWHPVFSASLVQHISDMHSKFTLRPHHVWTVSYTHLTLPTNREV